MSDTLALCAATIQAREKLHIGVVNAAKMVHVRRHEHLLDSLLASDLILADGMAVVWASRLLRCPLPERVAGIDLFEGLLALADRHRFSVFFLGATEQVLNETVRQVQSKYPDLRVAGKRNGYFDVAQSESVALEIRDTQCDMLFLGITSPKKEIFLAQWASRMGVPVCHGVGGSFDVMAGTVHRAPQLWQRLGLEWCYRLVQEPRRMWKRYLVTNTLFIYMVMKECLSPTGYPKPAGRKSSAGPSERGRDV